MVIIMDRTKRVYLGGLVVIALIWLYTGLTATDPLWAGKAIALSSLVLLAVALIGLVTKDGVEKS
ncbi:MAG: hypothetical protein GOV00_02940 [Candidatus Altiarchaeota archaeon]|nr:hypothetical protein [Candidatus Altiarchaeota archaeon]